MWKALRPRDLGNTYTHQGGSARIDWIYFPLPISYFISAIHLDATYVTDHSVLHAQCSLLSDPELEVQPRPSIWKINMSFLSEDAFGNLFTKFLATASALPLRRTNVTEWWDTVFKLGVKRIAQSYCRRRALLRKEIGR